MFFFSGKPQITFTGSLRSEKPFCRSAVIAIIVMLTPQHCTRPSYQVHLDLKAITRCATRRTIMGIVRPLASQRVQREIQEVGRYCNTYRTVTLSLIPPVAIRKNPTLFYPKKTFSKNPSLATRALKHYMAS